MSLAETEFKQTEIGIIPKDWQVRTLGELTENFDSRRVPIKESDREAGPFPYYGASGVIDYVSGHLFDGEYLLIAEDGENLRTRLTPIAFLARGKFWVNNHAHVVRGNEKADTRFLAYALQVANIDAFLSGTTVPKLSQNSMELIPLPCPRVIEQIAIAKVLHDIDSKIEINREMNEILEGIARAIFEHWLVDFEFPNEEGKPYKSSGGEMVDSEFGLIPQNWKLVPLPEAALVIDCLHAKKPEMSVSDFLLLQVYNINVDDGTLDLTEKYTVSKSDYETWIKNIEVRAGDCIITNAGIAGAIAQIPVNFKAGIGRNITAIRPESIPPTYLFRYLKSNYGQREIERNTDQGTIFNSLNVKGIRKVLVLMPPKKILARFESICCPLRERIERNVTEGFSLKQIRDALLPNLLSGKIRAPIRA